MPEKEIRPSPGEVWERTYSKTDTNPKEVSACFIYAKDGELYRAWFVFWQPDLVTEHMIDGQNGWKRVYTPTKPMAEVFFK